MRDAWAYPGAKCVCVNAAPDDGICLPIGVGLIYTISSIFDNTFVSRIGSIKTVSLAEVHERPNEFWLDRFEPVSA